tara:strand:- start:217 stop:414 length:198 start_codon:yes stop_codon:yes gene_type:complete
MLFDEDDNIVSVDMYVNQRNFNDVDSTDDVECHITRYDQPQIDYYTESSYTKNDDDNSYLVFDIK